MDIIGFKKHYQIAANANMKAFQNHVKIFPLLLVAWYCSPFRGFLPSFVFLFFFEGKFVCHSPEVTKIQPEVSSYVVHFWNGFLHLGNGSPWKTDQLINIKFAQICSTFPDLKGALYVNAELQFPITAYDFLRLQANRKQVDLQAKR